MNTSEMSDGVKIAITIIILCILIGIVITVVVFLKGTTDESAEDLEQRVTLMSESSMRDYEGSTYTGTQVKAYVELNRRKDLSIVVHTLKHPKGINYGRKLKGTNASHEPSYTNQWKLGNAVDAGPGGTVRPLHLKASTGTGFEQTISHYGDLTAMNKISHKDYVIPTNKFNSYLIEDTGGAILGVIFIQQKLQNVGP